MRHFENIEGGIGNDTIVGNNGANSLSGSAGNDLISGGDGNDTLDGGMGGDTLRGGAGDDLFIIDSFDTVEESADAGTDTVRIGATYSSANYTLANNIEILDASVATQAMSLAGNANANTITGSQFNDTLDGGGGDDRLEGGKGSDVFLANDGNDTFVGGDGVDLANYDGLAAGQRIVMDRSLDGNLFATVRNAANQIVEIDMMIGIEQIRGSLGHDFLLGSSAADTLLGENGDDTLDGGQGADSLVGGAGNDFYLLDKDDTIFETADGGIDTALIGPAYRLDTYTLGTNLERVDANTATQAMHLIGNDGDNTIMGSDYADVFEGGAGNDVYILGEGDVVLENANQGIDTVVLNATYAGTSYSLANNIEMVDARSAVQAMLINGSASENTILGGSGNDTLAGGEGNDTLDGGAGHDTASYALLTDPVISVAANLVTGQATIGTEIDTLISIENLTGGAGHDSLTGDGNDNILSGGRGDDTLIGGDGNDTADYSYLGPSQSLTINLAQAGANAIVSGSGSEADTLIAIENIVGGDSDDLILGDNANNDLRGGAGNDTISGGKGADTLDGGAGENTLTYANANATMTIGVTVNLASGTGSGGDANGDVITNFRNIIGSSKNDYLIGDDRVNRLEGGDGVDTLNGGNGADILIGGAGNDVYEIDMLDQIVEQNGGGFDTVRLTAAYTGDMYALQDNVEAIDASALNRSMTLYGTLGDDFIQGTQAADVFFGDIGNDTYVVTDDDIIQEPASGGVDTVILDRSYQAAVYRMSGVLNILDASRVMGGKQLISGQAATTIYGSEFDDTIISSAYNDALYGGKGDDHYYVKNTITVVEDADGGIDTVHYYAQAWDPIANPGLVITMANNIENAEILGYLPSSNDPFTLRGNNLQNAITGNSNADILQGQDGNDTLIGLDGHDTLEGGTGNDSLEGGNGDDSLDGGAGADTLKGGAGNDLYIIDQYDMVSEDPNAGLDTIQLSAAYGATSFTLNVANIEILDLSLLTQTVTVVGGAGNDSIIGGAVDDSVSGGGGNDTLLGGLGDDTLDGGSGNDSLSGDAGNDIFIASGGNDTISGGTGFDIISYANEGIGVRLEISSDGAGNLIASTYDISNALRKTDTLREIESIAGTAYNDSLSGDDNGNIFDAGAGNDLLDGGAGDDSLSGGLGNDALIGGVGNDTLDGGDGDDVLSDDPVSTISGLLYRYRFEEGSGSQTSDDGSTGLTGTLASGATWTSNPIGGGGLNFTGGLNDTQRAALPTMSIGGSISISVLAQFNSNGGGQEALIDFGNGAENGNIFFGRKSGTSDLILQVVNPSGTKIFSVANAIGANELALYSFTIGSDGIATIYKNGQALGLSTLTANGDMRPDKISRTSNLIGDSNASGDSTLNGAIYDISIYDRALSAAEIQKLAATLTAQQTYGSGDDSLIGGAGNDTLMGGLGNDTLDGGTGNDTVTYLTATGGVSVDLLNGTTSGAAGNDTLRSIEHIIGSDFADTLRGDDGANTIRGGNGNDTLIGGLGNDTLDGGTGFDTVDYSSRTVAVTANLATGSATIAEPVAETDTLMAVEQVKGGTANDVLIGDANANGLDGNAGNDALNGGAGNDTLIGGLGNDTLDGGADNDTVDYSYLVATQSLTVDLSAPSATGVVTSAMTGSVTETDSLLNIETIIGGAGNDLLVGNSGANMLRGGAGNNTLMGGAGADTLDGGVGGNNTLSYAYPRNVFGGSISFDDNSGITLPEPTKASINNGVFISVGAGILFYGANLVASTTYIVSFDYTTTSNGYLRLCNGVTFSQASNNGPNNTVWSSSWTGPMGTSGTCYAVFTTFATSNANAATPTFLSLGSESAFFYGTIDNFQITRADAGVTINLATNTASGGDATGDLISNFRNVTGTGAHDSLTGDGQDNLLSGGNGNDTLSGGDGNDTLDGGLGNDSMIGGRGDDVYIINNASDVTLENSNEGTDTVITNINYTLSSNLENLTVAASVTTGLILSGNALANSITGGIGNDTLTGNGGADTLVGGLGNDTYNLDNNLSIVENANGGVDTVVLSAAYSSTSYTLAANVENLVITAGGLARTIFGNAGNNTLTGSTASETIDGGDGNDLIDGGITGSPDYLLGGAGDDTLRGAYSGPDTLNGGLGNDYLEAYNNGDIFQFDWNMASGQGWGRDTIGTFELNADKIQIRGLGFSVASQADFLELIDATYSGLPMTVSLKGVAALGDLQTIKLDIVNNGTLRDLTFNDFLFVKDPNVTWLAGTANAETINGTTSNDTILGLAGNDTLVGDDGNDILDGGSGHDSLMGGNGHDTLIGNTGIDTLFGGTGNDLLILNFSQLANGSLIDGGAANDSFQFSPNATATNLNVTLGQLNTLLDNTETLDFTTANNKAPMTIDLSMNSADRTALNGITGNQALTIRYNITGTNDVDTINVSGAAGSDVSGTAGASGYTQNYYADAAKTQLLLTLIAA